MAIRHIIAKGIGFGPENVVFLPTHGFLAEAAPPPPEGPCLPVDLAIRFRYGTGRHWGTGWKYGGGTVSDPFVPCGDPCPNPRFDLEELDIPLQRVNSDGSRLLVVVGQDLAYVQPEAGGSDEIYYLQSPSGTWWEIVISASSGAISRQVVPTPGTTQELVVAGQDGKLWRYLVDDSGALRREGGSSPTPDNVYVPAYTKEDPC